MRCRTARLMCAACNFLARCWLTAIAKFSASRVSMSGKSRVVRVYEVVVSCSRVRLLQHQLTGTSGPLVPMPHWSHCDDLWDRAAIRETVTETDNFDSG